MSVAAFPKEVWLHIFLFLGEDDLASFAKLTRTCKFLHAVGDSNLVWKGVFKFHFVRVEVEDVPEPTFDVEDGTWGVRDDFSFQCVVCNENALAEDCFVFLDNCVLHRSCVDGAAEIDSLTCPHGCKEDDGFDRELFMCSACKKNSPLICWLKHSEDVECFLCDACVVELSATANPYCVCGACLNMMARPRVLKNQRFFELDKTYEKVDWKKEFMRVDGAGFEQAVAASFGAVRDHWFSTAVGVGICFLWTLFVLYAYSWLSWTKFACLVAFAILLSIYMISEDVFAKFNVYLRDGKVGPRFAKKIWKLTRWGSNVGVVLALSLFAVFSGTVVYDAILDFGVSVLFLIVSSIALAAALYYDCQRIVSFIVGLSFVAVPLVQIILKFFVWEDAEEDALDGMLFLWSFVA